MAYRAYCIPKKTDVKTFYLVLTKRILTDFWSIFQLWFNLQKTLKSGMSVSINSKIWFD